MLRDVAGPPEQTDADVTRMFTRAMAWRECPVSEDRMVEVNQLSLAFFRRHFPSRGGSNIWPTGLAKTSPTTPDSSLVKHPQVGPSWLTTSGATGLPTTK
jgi:hypothetical protein